MANFGRSISECNTKVDILMRHAKATEEALAGWEKAEAEVAFLKQELNENLKKRVATEERIENLDAALKECMQQLCFSREEQEERIHETVVKKSIYLKKEHKVLGEELKETGMRLAKLGNENSHLGKSHEDEKLIIDSSECKLQEEEDFNTLISKLDLAEKDNTTLRYEVSLLRKELEIRKKVIEISRRSADTSHKQHLEGVKKNMKLEKEYKRLLLMIQEQLPSPAASGKMKSEVEILGRELDQTSSPMADLMVKKLGADDSHEIPSTQVGTEVQDLPTVMELMHIPSLHKLSHGALCEGSHVNEFGCSESRASALMSELRPFVNGKPEESQSCRTVGISDISLMDDFVEMEKLAKSSNFSMNKSFEISHASSNESNTFLETLETELQVHSLKGTGNELVPLDNEAAQLKDLTVDKYPSWLQGILRLLLDQNRITQKSPDEILKEVRAAFTDICRPGLSEATDARKNSSCLGSSDSLHNCCNCWRPPKLPPDVITFCASDMNLSPKEIRSQQLQPNLNKSICKLIGLIEGVYQPSLDYDMQVLSENNGCSSTYNNSATSSGFTVRVFQWKSSELGSLLRQFVNTCTDVLNGNADLEKLVPELTSALDWIINHCFSVKDVSSMRDTIKNQFNWDGSQSDSEIEDPMNYPCSEAENTEPSDKMTLQLQSSATSNGWNNFFHMKEIQLSPKEENTRLNEKLRNMESVHKDLEGKLHSATKKIEDLMIQLPELEENIISLQIQLKASEKSKCLIEDQMTNYKLLNEDKESQLTVMRLELKEVHQKLSSFEVELERKIQCCKELEATCVQLHLRLDSVMKRGVMECEQKDRQLQMDWDITTASEKLAECQETLLNLGKQLKELSSPKEASLLDKVVSTIPVTAPRSKNGRHTSTLLYHMRAEDNCKFEDFESPKTKEVICTITNSLKPTTFSPNISNAPLGPTKSPERFFCSSTPKCKAEPSTHGRLAIVNSKRCGGGVSLVKKLLLGRKRDKRRKSLTMIA